MVVESTALIYLLSWNSRWSSETHLASRFQAMWRSLTRHQRRKTPVEFEEIRKKKTRCKFYLSATLEHQRYLFPKKCYMERLRCWQLRLKTKGDVFCFDPVALPGTDVPGCAPKTGQKLRPPLATRKAWWNLLLRRHFRFRYLWDLWRHLLHLTVGGLPAYYHRDSCINPL